MSTEASFEPTTRKRQQAKTQGQIPKSVVLSNVIFCLCAAGYCVWQVPVWIQELREVLMNHWLDSSVSVTNTEVLDCLTTVILDSIQIIGLPCVSLFAFACLAVWIQTGWTWVPERVSSGMERWSLSGYWDRLRSPVYSLLGVAALCGIIGIMLSEIWQNQEVIAATAMQVVQGEWQSVWAVVFGFGVKVGALCLAWGVLDYVMVRRTFEHRLRMTPEELRLEIKAISGPTSTRDRMRKDRRQVDFSARD